jgi:hypothetical protein
MYTFLKFDSILNFHFTLNVEHYLMFIINQLDSLKFTCLIHFMKYYHPIANQQFINVSKLTLFIRFVINLLLRIMH